MVDWSVPASSSPLFKRAVSVISKPVACLSSPSLWTVSDQGPQAVLTRLLRRFDVLKTREVKKTESCGWSQSLFTLTQMSLNQPKGVSSGVKCHHRQERKQLQQQPSSRGEKGTVGFRRATPSSDFSLNSRISIGAANRLKLSGLHLCHPENRILHRRPGTPTSLSCHPGPGRHPSQFSLPLPFLLLAGPWPPAAKHLFSQEDAGEHVGSVSIPSSLGAQELTL